VTSARNRLCSGVLLFGVAGAEVCVSDLRGGVVTKGSLFSTSSSWVWVTVVSIGRVILDGYVTCQ
jgi:hypothetical protein